MLTTKLTSELMGATVRSSDGEKLGKIGHIFLDDRSGWLEWVTVSTGLFGPRESFLPLAQIRLDGADARVPYDTMTVTGAPNVDIDGGHLSERDEAELYRYYGLTPGQPSGGNGPGRLRRYLVPDPQP
jgi:hypothetical protein